MRNHDLENHHKMKHGNKVNQQMFYMEDPATDTMVQVRQFFEHVLVPLAIIIVLIVFLLLFINLKYYSKKNNPVPEKTKDSFLLEFAWTVIPLLVIILLMFPSIKLHQNVLKLPEKFDMTINVTGNQWYWEYEYVDTFFPLGVLSFTSTILNRDNSESLEDQVEKGVQALRSVDNPLVVPSGSTIRINITSNDVIHGWSVPAFAVKMDAVPGRLNTTWFRIQEGREGIYYGYCTELCGKDHAYMPIEIHVLTRDDFDRWVEEKKELI